jgi:Protein of unknown function (DUF1571)
MRRLLLLLPLLLFLIPVFSFLLSPPPAPVSDRPAPPSPAPPCGTPASTDDMERLAQEDPVAFLQRCLGHYDQNVRGYRLLMHKQERIGGKLQPREIIEVCFREPPFSVRLHWREGARLAEQALYVDGANDGKMLVRPALLLARNLIVSRDPDGSEARQSGRFSIRDYGLKKGMERTLHTWQAAREKNELHVAFLGERKLDETDGRSCLVLRRDQYARPEGDGVTEVTVYIDRETWLQVGTVAHGEGGQLIGSYFFRDLQLNPEFEEGLFSRERLGP